MIFPIPRAAPIIGAVAALVVAWAWGYTLGHASADAALQAANAVSRETNERYRRLEKETADAQAGYVAAYTRNRDAARAEWVRIKAASRRDVPSLCPVPASTGDPAGAAVEGPGVTAGELAAALEAGEYIAATLRLCQTELRQCAGMR